MKESKLMKEVVKRSVEPDLDAISSRILEAHEQKKETQVASVRTHYLSSAVACVGLVFMVGLVMGLLIMRGVMKRDFEPNTAPEIIDSTPKTSAADPFDSSITESYPYDYVENDVNKTPLTLKYISKTYYTYRDGFPATGQTRGQYPINERVLKFLSEQTFLGVVNNTDYERGNYKYLQTNADFLDGKPVFKDRKSDTLYVYTNDGMLVFGTSPTSVPEFPNEGLGLTEPDNVLPADDDRPVVEMRFRGLRFTYLSNSNNSFEHKSQQYMLLDQTRRDLLDSAVFLGIKTDVVDAATLAGVTGDCGPMGCAVFYQPEQNMMILYWVAEYYGTTYMLVYYPE